MIALRVVVLSVGAGLGVFFPFLSVILRERGFDDGSIGFTIAVGAVAFTIAVPLWGHLADVLLGRTRALAASAVGAAFTVLLINAPVPALIVAACVVGYYFFESAWQPLADALTVNAVADQSRDYARIRLLASFSFAAVSIAAGQLFNQTGYAPAPFLFAVCAGVVAAAALLAPDVERADLAEQAVRAAPEAPREGRQTWSFGSTGVAFRVAPRLALVLGGVALVHFGIIGGFTFLPLRIESLGGSAGDVALLAGLSAAAEIPAMLLAGRVATRIGLRGMFVGSALLYAACLASWTVLDTPTLLIATRLVTGVSFAGLVVSGVRTIGALLPPSLQGTGQALYQTIGFGVAAIGANAIGGVIYGSLGHAPFFGLGAILAVLAAAVGWIAVPGRAGPAPERAIARVG
ncbi:MAG TPA: MFS transporter [Clostridia bacterium]|nr:MFS transporter [Clostridia bacterium]